VKLATWNVNSLKVRLPHLLDWLAVHSPDCVCIQETKTEDDKFPREAIEAAGYAVAFIGQKTYNGVALVTKKPVTDVVASIPNFEDEQKRVIAATLDGVRVVCAYVPNGQSVESDKYQYKLKWLRAFAAWLDGELKQHPKLAVLGDYNIAPEDRDVHNPKKWAGQVLCSEPERDAFKRLLDLGLEDSFRRFEQPEKSFTWWDYRLNGFARNWGLRIDHILASKALAATCTSCVIDLEPRKLERPSDHAPVMAAFAHGGTT
jgi:exodeoxyribonuclease III